MCVWSKSTAIFTVYELPDLHASTPPIGLVGLPTTVRLLGSWPNIEGAASNWDISFRLDSAHGEEFGTSRVEFEELAGELVATCRTPTIERECTLRLWVSGNQTEYADTGLCLRMACAPVIVTVEPKCGPSSGGTVVALRIAGAAPFDELGVRFQWMGGHATVVLPLHLDVESGLSVCQLLTSAVDSQCTAEISLLVGEQHWVRSPMTFEYYDDVSIEAVSPTSFVYESHGDMRIEIAPAIVDGTEVYVRFLAPGVNLVHRAHSAGGQVCLRHPLVLAEPTSIEVDISLNGADYSPAVEVQCTGAVSPASCTLAPTSLTSLQSLVAGRAMPVTIEARDKKGMLITAEPGSAVPIAAVFDIVVEAIGDLGADEPALVHFATTASVSALATGDGAIGGGGMVVMRASGMFGVSITLAGIHISGSPFLAFVRSADVEASRFVAIGAGMQEYGSVAGTECHFLVYACDAFGNRVNEPLPADSMLEVSIQQVGEPEPEACSSIAPAAESTAEVLVGSNMDGSFNVQVSNPPLRPRSSHSVARKAFDTRLESAPLT
jgi:hypothetical protein